MASKKFTLMHRRDCDKTFSRPEGAPKDHETQPVVERRSKAIAMPTGRKPTGLRFANCRLFVSPQGAY